MSNISAEYIDHMGSDDRVVDSARVSFSKEAGNFSKDQNDRLLSYLAKHNHFSPFTHPQITLRYTVPIFVARQEFKHQIGFTRNEQSRRYVDDTPEFYVPEVWRSRPDGSVKQGSGREEIDIDKVDVQGVTTLGEHYREAQQWVLNTYNLMIKEGVAPEQARMILPQSMMTSYYITGSLAAFARFYRQRTDPHAQVEIQELAHMVGDIIQPLFPVSWAALTES